MLVVIADTKGGHALRHFKANRVISGRRTVGSARPELVHHVLRDDPKSVLLWIEVPRGEDIGAGLQVSLHPVLLCHEFVDRDHAARRVVDCLGQTGARIEAEDKRAGPGRASLRELDQEVVDRALGRVCVKLISTRWVKSRFRSRCSPELKLAAGSRPGLGDIAPAALTDRPKQSAIRRPRRRQSSAKA